MAILKRDNAPSSGKSREGSPKLAEDDLDACKSRRTDSNHIEHWARHRTSDDPVAQDRRIRSRFRQRTLAPSHRAGHPLRESDVWADIGHGRAQ